MSDVCVVCNSDENEITESGVCEACSPTVKTIQKLSKTKEVTDNIIATARKLIKTK